jgi:hypothetical protein
VTRFYKEPDYADITDFEEDKRIEIIGNRVIGENKICSFITDDEAGKADRYVRKLKEKFPGIVEIARGRGPVANTVWVKVGPPQTQKEK